MRWVRTNIEPAEVQRIVGELFLDYQVMAEQIDKLRALIAELEAKDGTRDDDATARRDADGRDATTPTDAQPAG